MTIEMMKREDLTELSDADLDCVAGGQCYPTTFTQSTVGGYVVLTNNCTGEKTYYVQGTTTPLGTSK
jgi:hypothetical protein